RAKATNARDRCEVGRAPAAAAGTRPGEGPRLPDTTPSSQYTSRGGPAQTATPYRTCPGLPIGSRGNDDRELTANGGGPETLEVRGGRRAEDLLELLGQLASHDDLAATEDLGDGLQRRHDPMRRLAEHDRRLEIVHSLQAIDAAARRE